MRKIILDKKEFSYDELLDSFNINAPASSIVEFFGDNGKDVFIQFKRGASYIYKNVSDAHIKEMYAAPSIGRFISVLSKNYTYVPVKRALVVTNAPVAIATHDNEVNATIITPAQ